MTYSEMIFAMDNGLTYSNRGRKGYKKANEKWTLTITTTEEGSRTFTAYHKTENAGRKWVEQELSHFQSLLNHRNKWDNKDEKIAFYKIDRIDRMNKEYHECVSYSTK